MQRVSTIANVDGSIYSLSLLWKSWVLGSIEWDRRGDFSRRHKRSIYLGILIAKELTLVQLRPSDLVEFLLESFLCFGFIKNSFSKDVHGINFSVRGHFLDDSDTWVHALILERLLTMQGVVDRVFLDGRHIKFPLLFELSQNSLLSLHAWKFDFLHILILKFLVHSNLWDLIRKSFVNVLESLLSSLWGLLDPLFYLVPLYQFEVFSLFEYSELMSLCFHHLLLHFHHLSKLYFFSLLPFFCKSKHKLSVLILFWRLF